MCAMGVGARVGPETPVRKREERARRERLAQDGLARASPGRERGEFCPPTTTLSCLRQCAEAQNGRMQ